MVEKTRFINHILFPFFEKQWEVLRVRFMIRQSQVVGKKVKRQHDYEKLESNIIPGLQKEVGERITSDSSTLPPNAIDYS